VSDPVLKAVNEVRANLNLPALESLSDETHLRADLQMDSLDLAELAVRIEDVTGTDIFASGLVSTVAEVRSRLQEKG